jgi:hypothetical protein
VVRTTVASSGVDFVVSTIDASFVDVAAAVAVVTIVGSLPDVDIDVDDYDGIDVLIIDVTLVVAVVTIAVTLIVADSS